MFGFSLRGLGISKPRGSRYPRIMLRRPRHLIVIPTVKDVSEVDVKYPLIEPFAKAEIKWVPEKKGLIYRIMEPELSGKEKKLLERVGEALTEVIDVKMSSIEDRSRIIEYMQKKAESVLDDLGIRVSGETYGKLMYYIIRDFFGLNEIEPMMYDPYIEDIGCNGLNTPVFVIHKKFGSIQTSLSYASGDRLTDFVVKLSERCGRYISYAVPLLDGSLPDGSRVQASLAKDVTTRGPTFSIRKFRQNPYSPVDLIEMGTVSSEMMAYLWLLVHYNASILISGGVSTGKTTFLNVLSMFIPPEDKVISIEDTKEINLPHENWIPSVSRMGFGIPGSSGKRYGEVTLFDLLKESFRQNPDYVVVGEVRGREAYVMFQGIASGHPSMGTIHAGSIEDVMKRLETPPIELSPSLIESLDLLVVLTNAKEKGKSARRVKEIVEIQSVDSRTGIAHTKDNFSWIPSDDVFRENLADSDLLRRISFQEGVSYQEIMKELDDRKRMLEWMRRHKIFQFDEVCRLINLYYKEKDTVMKWVVRDLSPNAPERKTRARKAWKPKGISKPNPPPMTHKPDLSYDKDKPKVELKEILSKVKTSPLRIPEPGRFLKNEAAARKPSRKPSRKSPLPKKPSKSRKPVPVKARKPAKPSPMPPKAAQPAPAPKKPGAQKPPLKPKPRGMKKPRSRPKPKSPTDRQIAEIRKLRKKIRDKF